MVIQYISSFDIIGQSEDAKPVDVPAGMRFWETDSQKVYIFSAGTWQEVKAGSGVWSASSAEALTNKTVVLNSNTVKTTLGTYGLFGFGNTGQFVFIPIGSANRYLKVNSTGNGFEFGDPASTGSWNPSSTETITNKTLVFENNTIKALTPAAGQLLLDNGTKFVPLAKGSIGQVVKVKSDGTVGWDTDQTGAADYSGLPSKTGYHEGYFIPSSNFDASSMPSQAVGILKDEIGYSGYISDPAPTRAGDNTRGRYVNFNVTSSSSFHQFQTNYIFMRDWSSYMLVKFRLSSTSSANMFMGFTSSLPVQFSTETVFNNTDSFAFGKLSGFTNWRIFHNAGTTTATIITLGTAADTNPHTIELVFDPTNNRVGYRMDMTGSFTYVTTNIPRTGFSLSEFITINGTSATANNLETYLWEAKNKIMF